jgi:hypothetical protein
MVAVALGSSASGSLLEEVAWQGGDAARPHGLHTGGWCQTGSGI